jgi:hypothetical protein
MQDSDWARILEPALHAAISTRCHRAYRHDLKNGLQGIYGGFDALNRLLQLQVRDTAKVERTTDFVRQAVTGHEKGLERVLHSLSPLEQAPESMDVSLLAHELCKFLTNDATAHRVTLRCSAAQPAVSNSRPPKLRLALLSLMVDAIDAMPAGGTLQLSVSTDQHGVQLLLRDTREAAASADPWTLDLTTTPPHRGWTLFVVRQLILTEGGSIDCDFGAGRTFRIILPTAVSIPIQTQ